MPIPDNFSGFPEPKFTSVPNLILDSMAGDMSGSQLKVLLHIVRETVGWRKGHMYKPISIARIQDVMGLSKESVTDALGWLLERRLILRRKLRGEFGKAAVSTYKLRFETDEDEEDPRSENPTLENDPKVGKIDEKSDLGGVPSFSVFKEKKEKIINTPPSFSQDQEPTASTPDQNSLNSEDLKSVIVQVVRGVPGVRSISKGIRGEIESGLIGLHPGWSDSQVWYVFRRWREKDSIREGWEPRRKVAAFMSYMRSIYPDTVPVDPHQEPATQSQRPYRTSEAGNSAKATEMPKTTFPSRWNELVPEAPADPELFPSCHKSYRDQVFVDRFDEICAKARRLIQDGADLKFGFLLKESAGRFRWQELLADELNWMRPKGSTKSNGGTADGGRDEFLEKTLEIIRNQKGKKP